MKYIFPKQFGLHNVFTSPADVRETVQPFKDYTLREQEIARHQRQIQLKSASPAGSPKVLLPRRLRGQAVALVKKLQKLHGRCSYTELLRHYCPHVGTLIFFYINVVAKICQKSHEPLQQATRNDPRHRIRDQSAQTSPSDDLDGNKIKGVSYLTNESGNVSMIEFATPASDVSAFCRAVLSSLIPYGFWGVGKGADANQKAIMQHIDRFIHLRRFENLSLHLVSQKLKVKGSLQRLRQSC